MALTMRVWRYEHPDGSAKLWGWAEKDGKIHVCNGKEGARMPPYPVAYSDGYAKERQKEREGYTFLGDKVVSEDGIVREQPTDPPKKQSMRYYYVRRPSLTPEDVAKAFDGTPAALSAVGDAISIHGKSGVLILKLGAATEPSRARIPEVEDIEASIMLFRLAKECGGTITSGADDQQQTTSTLPEIAKSLGVKASEVEQIAADYGLIPRPFNWGAVAKRSGRVVVSF